jgi:hypothetical protein
VTSSASGLTGSSCGCAAPRSAPCPAMAHQMGAPGRWSVLTVDGWGHGCGRLVVRAAS